MKEKANTCDNCGSPLASNGQGYTCGRLRFGDTRPTGECWRRRAAKLEEQLASKELSP